MPRAGLAALVAVALSTGGLAATATAADATYVERGEASWYGDGFHGRETASGEIFDENRLTAAHPALPLGAEVKVTNLETGRSVEVEINDRGPFVAGRVIDLSKAAARKLDMLDAGLAEVRVEADAAALNEAREAETAAVD